MALSIQKTTLFHYAEAPLSFLSYGEFHLTIRLPQRELQIHVVFIKNTANLIVVICYHLIEHRATRDENNDI